MEYNQKEIERIKWLAKRTIRVVDLIIAGDNDSEIVRKVGCPQSIPSYYRRRISQ